MRRSAVATALDTRVARSKCPQPASAALLPLAVCAYDRGEVERFATLPSGAHNPQGITAHRHSRIYVTTFDVTRGGSPGQMFVFDRPGELERTVSIVESANLLLDLAFHPKHNALFVIDFGPEVLKVNSHTGASSLFAKIPGGSAPGPTC